MHVGPIYQMAEDQLPDVPLSAAAGCRRRSYTLANYAIFFSESLYFLPLIRSFIFAFGGDRSHPHRRLPRRLLRRKGRASPDRRSKALLLLLVPFWAGELIRTFSVIMLLANRGALNVLLREIWASSTGRSRCSTPPSRSASASST
jgi:spermidine/putrescine transport system permease protein